MAVLREASLALTPYPHGASLLRSGCRYDEASSAGRSRQSSAYAMTMTCAMVFNTSLSDSVRLLSFVKVS